MSRLRRAWQRFLDQLVRLAVHLGLADWPEDKGRNTGLAPNDGSNAPREERPSMSRGRWNTSYRDKAKAQYQADQIAAANDEVRQAAWREGYAAGFQAGRESVLNAAPPPGHDQQRRG